MSHRGSTRLESKGHRDPRSSQTPAAVGMGQEKERGLLSLWRLSLLPLCQTTALFTWMLLFFQLSCQNRNVRSWDPPQFLVDPVIRWQSLLSKEPERLQPSVLPGLAPYAFSGHSHSHQNALSNTCWSAATIWWHNAKAPEPEPDRIKYKKIKGHQCYLFHTHCTLDDSGQIPKSHRPSIPLCVQ